MLTVSGAPPTSPAKNLLVINNSEHGAKADGTVRTDPAGGGDASDLSPSPRFKKSKILSLTGKSPHRQDINRFPPVKFTQGGRDKRLRRQIKSRTVNEAQKVSDQVDFPSSTHKEDVHPFPVLLQRYSSPCYLQIKTCVTPSPESPSPPSRWLWPKWQWSTRKIQRWW